MTINRWEKEYDVTRKRILRNPVVEKRELSPDEKEVAKLLKNPAWESLVRVATVRAAKTKARIYREDLSGKELELGKLLGSLECLEWVVRLPDTLLTIHTQQEK